MSAADAELAPMPEGRGATPVPVHGAMYPHAHVSF